MPSNDYVVKCKVEDIIKTKADTLYKTIEIAKKFRLDTINQEAFENDTELKKLKADGEKIAEENRKLSEELNRERASFEAKIQERAAKGKAKADDATKRVHDRKRVIEQKISAEISKTEMTSAELRARVQEKMTKAHETLWVAGAGQELKDVLSQVPTIDELRNDGLKALVSPDQMQKLLLGMAPQAKATV